MVTKHVLQNLIHKAPASFRLLRVLYLRCRFQLSLGCEILGPRRGEIMRRTLTLTGVVAFILAAATILHAKEITVRGKLQKTVEAGGWLIVGNDAKYLILNAKNYQSNAWLKNRRVLRQSARRKT